MIQIAQVVVQIVKGASISHGEVEVAVHAYRFQNSIQ